MLSIFVVSFVQTARNLLPMLESVRLIKVLHPIQQSAHHFGSQFFIVQLLFQRIKHSTHPQQPVLLDNLIVASSQIEGELGSMEPLLGSPFGLQECYILFENLLFDSECLQNIEHFPHGIVGFS